MDYSNEINAQLDLGGGAILYLFRPDTSSRWQIRLYEFSHRLAFSIAGPLCLWHSDGLPEAWRSLTFDTPESAESFVLGEIAADRCPKSEDRIT
jgi:hypothetical protein